MAQHRQTEPEGVISRFFSTVVFWWLAAMGTATLALSALVPAWVEYKQTLQVRDQLRLQVERLQKQADRNDYFIDSYKNSPQALDLLAISEFGYRRPDEVPLPLPRQIAMSFRPAGYTGPGLPRGGGPGPRSIPRPASEINGIERYVEKAQALANHHLGPARAIGLVEMFCDKTSRSGLAAAALAVLAAAFFLCRSPAPENR